MTAAEAAMSMCINPLRRSALLLAVVVSLQACGGAGDSQAEELARFGVIRGQANTLEVAGVTFRFPASYALAPEAYKNQVRKGHADKVTFYINYSKFFERSLTVVTPQQVDEKRQAVRVTITWGGGEDPRRANEMPYARTFRGVAPAWKDVGVRWGLREFAVVNTSPHDPNELSATSYFKSLDERTPKGSPWTFDCWPHSDLQRSYLCLTRFDHPVGVGVEIFTESEQLPQWRYITEAVIATINSLALDRAEGRVSRNGRNPPFAAFGGGLR